MTEERFDAVVLGAGPGGEVVAGRLAKGGLRVALVERELIGGECAYYACIPSKTLLHPVALRSSVQRSFALSTPRVDLQAALDYRDEMIRHLDDSGQIEAYGKRDVAVVKGEGRIIEPGVVEAAGRRLGADHIVVATGSQTAVPPIEGLEETGYWTNREATTFRDLPRSIACMGGGPVGCELGQAMRRYGAEVVIIEGASHLVNREDPAVGEILAHALRTEGVDVRTNVMAERVEAAGGNKRLLLSDGSEVEAEEILVATGRRPRTVDLGLDVYGIDGEEGVSIDEYGRATADGRPVDGLWAVGDATAVAMFTHVAKYQGRAVAANIQGASWELDYRALPRIIFTDPISAAVGETPATASDKGFEIAVERVTFDSIARPWTMEPDPAGELEILLERDSGRVIGAWACGDMAGEWIHVAAMAIKLDLGASTLVDTMFQFPSFSELYVTAGERFLS